jgi:CheY-like chemotaxis protein
VNSTPAPADAATARGPEPARSRAPIRVLVVDDDPLSRSFQTHLLSLLGHKAQAQGDSTQALSQALSGDFDILMLDLGMPGLDGFEVLRRLREHEAQAKRRPLAVVAVTGYASESDRLRCLVEGFNDHLAKPIQAATLSETLERVLGEVAASDTDPTNSDVARLRATVRRLNESRPGDRTFAPTVTESFALRSAQLLEALRRAQQQRDASSIGRTAQALKASAEFMGALRLAQMCLQLEHPAQQGAWDEVEAALGHMTDEHQVVLTLLFESTRK